MTASLGLYCIAYLEDNQSALDSINLILPSSKTITRLLESKILINEAKFEEAEIILKSILIESFEKQILNEFVSSLLLLGFIYWRRGNQKEVKYILDQSQDLIQSRCSSDELVQDLLYALYYNLNGNYFYDMSDEANSIFSSYNKFYDIHSKYHNQQELARAYNNLGIAFYRKGDLENAMRYYELSLNSHRQIKRDTSSSANLLNIGEIHLKRGHLSTALDYFEESLEEVEKQKDPLSWAVRYLYIAKVHTLWGNHYIAREYLLMASTLFNQLGNELQLALVKTQIGKLNMNLGKYKSALQNFSTSLNYLINQTTNDFELTETLCCIIDLNNRLDNKDDTERYLKILQDIASKSLNPHVRIRSDLASIVIKKDQGRLESLVSSIEQLEKLTKNHNVDIFVTYDAMTKYGEILLKEFEILGNAQLVPAITSIITQLQQFGEQEYAISYFAISQLLKSKLLWHSNQIDDALELLENTRKYVIEKELIHLLDKISELLYEFNKIKEKIKFSQNDIKDTLEEMEVMEYLNLLQRERIKQNDTKNSDVDLN